MSGSIILPQDAPLGEVIKRVNQLSVSKVNKVVLERKLDDSKESLDFSVIEKLITDSIDGQRKILNTDPTIYSDGAMGVAVPNSPFGWSFSNPNSNGSKINWYYYNKQYNIFMNKFNLNSLKNMYCVITYLNGNVENPFFIAYTTPTGTGDYRSWYHTKIFYGSNDLPADCDKTKPIFLYTGPTDPKIHPEIPASNRQQLLLNSSLCGPTSIDDAAVAASTDEVNLLSLQTSSQAVSYGNYNFICSEMGFISNDVSRQDICVTNFKDVYTITSNIQKNLYTNIQRPAVAVGTPSVTVPVAFF